MNENTQRPLTISEAAQRLNISDQAARAALLRGELKGFRIGRSWRISPDSVERKLGGATPEAR
jgi:excisionase family DNA binding protein